MFAIIETGGKQYKVELGEKIQVEKLDVKDGETAVFDQVLLRTDEKEVVIGNPYIKGARVEAKVLKSGKGVKKIVFKYHPKTRYRKKKGHRQPYTEVEILKIK
ncbi:MAG: 50S ribosomal protein L21 [Patescibacteria group bacterium]|nr:50S ribosomal protein L21 [Patescibacteria group bacterium]